MSVAFQCRLEDLKSWDLSLTRPRCRWRPPFHPASSSGRCGGTTCAVGKQSSSSEPVHLVDWQGTTALRVQSDPWNISSQHLKTRRVLQKLPHGPSHLDLVGVSDQLVDVGRLPAQPGRVVLQDHTFSGAAVQAVGRLSFAGSWAHTNTLSILMFRSYFN